MLQCYKCTHSYLGMKLFASTERKKQAGLAVLKEKKNAWNQNWNVLVKKLEYIIL